MGFDEESVVAIYGYTQLLFGVVLLLGLIYTYLNIYRLKNLNFITKLLSMMLCIALTEIYTGVLFIGFVNSASWAQRSPLLNTVDAIVNIVYEINTILITWIVGFQFNDSAIKLELIETLRAESKPQFKP